MTVTLANRCAAGGLPLIFVPSAVPRQQGRGRVPNR
jgi:hypothetical protein